MDENERSNLVNGTMCPKITGGSGGDVKKNFLESPSMLSRFQISGNFHLGELVVGVKGSVADRYRKMSPTTKYLYDPKKMAKISVDMNNDKPEGTKPEEKKTITEVPKATKTGEVREELVYHGYMKKTRNDVQTILLMSSQQRLALQRCS